MNYIIYFIYGMSLPLIWGLLLLDAKHPGSIGILVCLIYTFYSQYFLRKLCNREHWTLTAIKLAFPIAYLIAVLITDAWSLSLLLNPILIAFVIFLIGHYFRSFRTQISFQFFMLFIIYLYSFTLFNYWSILENTYEGEVYDFRKNSNSDLENGYQLFNHPIPLNIQLSDFNFQSIDSVLYKIPKEGKPILLETWNERCIPCLKAIDHLQPFFNENAHSISHFYIYEPEPSCSFSTEQVFSFSKIDNHNKILIDTDNEMYSKLNLSGYPYFLLFNSKSELTHIQFGFSEEYSSDMKQMILSLTE